MEGRHVIAPFLPVEKAACSLKNVDLISQLFIVPKDLFSSSGLAFEFSYSCSFDALALLSF